MKNTLSLALILLLSINLYAQQDSVNTKSQTELNKEIVARFYQDLWFSNHTERYADYVADTYVVHDIGERKGVTEAALEQKRIADFFWDNGSLQCKMDYQIAEGDLVATRWTAAYEPNTLLGNVAIGKGEIPIINVFRMKEGKIVEIWNHRHDIDTPQTMKYVLQGLLIGLGVALVPTFFMFRLRRRLKKVAA